MSFTQLAIAGVAIALLAPSAAHACGGGAGAAITTEAVVTFGIIATVTLPIWIVPAAVYGIAVGVKSVKRSADERKAERDLAKKEHSDFAATAEQRATTEALRPFFEEAEKNPTAYNLLRLGVHMNIVGDLFTARRFLRKSIALAKTNDSAKSGLSETQLLPLLALANHQLGNIQFRLHIHQEAYDHFAEAKRLLDALAKFAPAPAGKSASATNEQNAKSVPTTTTTNDNDDDDDEGEESMSLLGETEIQHDLAWALLHKALYSDVIHTDLAAIAKSAEALEKVRGVSDTYELHYAIAEFFDMTRSIVSKWPPYEAGQNRAVTVGKFLKEALPELKEKFCLKVPPLFDALVAKLRSDGTDPSKRDSPEHLCFVVASSYLAKSCYIKGDDQSLELARKTAQRVSDLLSSCPNYDKSLAVETAQIEYYTCLSENPENEYFLIQYCSSIPPLAAPHGVKCGTAPHAWSAYKCKFLSFCQHCQKFINWDENQDGVFRCQYCKFICHAKCKEELGEDNCCPVASNNESMQEHVHIMKKTLLGKPTWCSFCKDYIKNPFGAFGCSICAAEVHESCLDKMGKVLISGEQKK